MFEITRFYGRGLSALCPTPSIVTLAFKCKLTLLGNHPNFVGAALFLFSCDWFWIFTILFTSIWRTAEDHTYCGLYSSTCSAWVAFEMVDSAIHQINLCPADNAIDFRNTYPLDSDLSGGKRSQTGARSLKTQSTYLFGSVGWFSNRTGTSVHNGSRKSNKWLDQWQSGKLGTGSRV